MIVLLYGILILSILINIPFVFEVIGNEIYILGGLRLLNWFAITFISVIFIGNLIIDIKGDYIL